MKVLSIVLLVFAIYFNVLLFYGLFSDKNDKININAIITSVDVNGISITYSYEYNGKTYTRNDITDKNVKVGDLYPITINKNGDIDSPIFNSISDVLGYYLVTILVFLSILFYGLSYYTSRN